MARAAAEPPAPRSPIEVLTSVVKLLRGKLDRTIQASDGLHARVDGLQQTIATLQLDRDRLQAEVARLQAAIAAPRIKTIRHVRVDGLIVESIVTETSETTR